LPETILAKAQKKGPRSSVSAEAFGAWNKKSDFKPRVVAKAQDTRDKISKRLKASFLFQSLSDRDFEIVVDAMEEKKFAPGEYVIKQGEDGSELFVVESGVLSCTKLFKG
jgi:cAMP-dependent protein kinase regulator